MNNNTEHDQRDVLYEVDGPTAVVTINRRRLSDFAVKVLGPKVVADTGEWGTLGWTWMILGAPG